MVRIVTVAVGGPENPVLVQGELVAEENGLTSVKVSENVIVRGKRIIGKITGGIYETPNPL